MHQNEYYGAFFMGKNKNEKKPAKIAGDKLMKR